MASYDDFLRLINEGWKGFVTLPGFEVVEKHGGTARGVAVGAGAIVGGVAGGLVGYALSGGNKALPKEIHTSARVAEKGIVIHQAVDDGSDLRIPWEEILNIKKWEHNSAKVMLTLINGIEI